MTLHFIFDDISDDKKAFKIINNIKALKTVYIAFIDIELPIILENTELIINSRNINIKPFISSTSEGIPLFPEDKSLQLQMNKNIKYRYYSMIKFDNLDELFKYQNERCLEYSLFYTTIFQDKFKNKQIKCVYIIETLY